MIVMDASQRLKIDLRKLAELTATKLDDMTVPAVERVLKAAMPLVYEATPIGEGPVTGTAKFAVSVED